MTIPADALYGAGTARAIANCAVEGPTLDDSPDVVRAYLEVKLAAARANVACGALDAAFGDAIIAACRELLAGPPRDAFPLAVVQGGGGTATNINVNEVVANAANERSGSERGRYHPVHPGDHVNRSQSTNDTFPTVLQLVCIRAARRLDAALERLADTYDRKAAEFDDDAERLGRTCLRDALPVPIAATHRSQAGAVRRAARTLRSASAALLAVPLGATAVGTGVGAPEGYRELAVGFLADETGLELVPAPDLFDALANIDGVVALADAMERAALLLDRYARDLRFLSAGPRGGAGEVELPDVQVGSSIMPGKSNPVIPELLMQVALQVRAAAFVVRGAAALGELELNVMESVVVAELPVALRRLAQATDLFAERCVEGLRWDTPRVEEHLAASLLDITLSAYRDGYAAVTTPRAT